LLTVRALTLLLCPNWHLYLPQVKRAEAEAESMYLSGLGVARQRKAIMMGLK
jgi:hypothetical protein